MENNCFGISFVLLVIIIHGITANTCGELSFEKPEVTEGETARLIYKPFNKQATRHWFREITGIIRLYPDGTSAGAERYAEESVGDTFTLSFAPVTATDVGQYILHCGSGLYSNRASLNVTPADNKVEVKSCGTLEGIANPLPEGAKVQLVFKIIQGQAITWEKRTNNDFIQLHNNENKYANLTNDAKTIHNMYIYRTTYRDSGEYRVNCGTVVSNSVQITIDPTPPSDIQFSNVVNISDCSGCIAAQLNAHVVVECFVDGGSEPIEINMSKDGRTITNVSRRRENNKTYLKHDYMTTSGSFGVVFTCTVKIPALTFVKQKSARLYIKADPSTVELKVKQYKENEPGEIRCLTAKGRPPVKSMIYVNTFQQNNSTVSSIESDHTFTVTTIYVRNFTRTDNGLKVYCSSTIINTKCSNTSNLDVLFPPKNAIVKEIKKNNLENGDTELTLQCKVNESNPRSVIKWEGIKKNPRSLLDSGYTKHSPTQGWIYTEERVFNLTKEDNYRSIRCVVSNEMFPGLDLVATFKPNITYAPTVTISGVDSRVVYLGDEVFLTCNVDSNPQSRVSWYSHTDEIKELYGVKTLVLHLTNVSLDHSQTYSCSAHNGIGGIRSSNITLIVKDDSEKPETETLTESGGSSVAVPVIGGVVVIVVAAVAIAVFVIVRKKRQNAPLERRGTHQVKIEDRKRSEQPTGDEPVYNNTAASGHEQEMEDSPEYACVAPKKERERNKASSVSNNDTDKVDPLNEKGDKLIYAELDLTDQGADNAVKRPLVIGDEQTEYVSIDFSKTGTATQEDVKEP